MSPTLTQADEMVLALARLEQRHKRPATIEELVVEVWTADKGRWGLPGYEGLYPHSNRISAALSCRSGPVKGRGWIERPVAGLGQVRLTESGWLRLAELTESRRAA